MPDTDIKKENAKLRAELTRLKQAPDGSGTVEPETNNDELDKLVADAKAVRSLAKSVPGLGDALAGMDARIAEIRADRLKVKPGSERLRQLEGETKRKQSELASIQSKRAAANERIAKEQAKIEKLDADGLLLEAAIAKLQESVAKLAEEIQVGNTGAIDKEKMEVDPEVAQVVATNLGVEGGAKRVLEIFAALAQKLQPTTAPAPMPQEVWHEAAATSQEDSQDLDSWLEGDSLRFTQEQRAAMADDKFLQLGTFFKGKGKGVRSGPYG
jgi:hypothetical protein